MGKMSVMVVLVFTLTLLFSIVGAITDNTGILNKVGVPSDIETDSYNSNSDFFLSIFYDPDEGSLTGVSTGILIGLGLGIVVGFFTRGTPENFIILPLIILLSGFIGSFTSIIQKFQDQELWLYIPVLFLMVACTIMYIMTSVEYFRGNV